MVSDASVKMASGSLALGWANDACPWLHLHVIDTSVVTGVHVPSFFPFTFGPCSKLFNGAWILAAYLMKRLQKFTIPKKGEVLGSFAVERNPITFLPLIFGAWFHSQTWCIQEIWLQERQENTSQCRLSYGLAVGINGFGCHLVHIHEV